MGNGSGVACGGVMVTGACATSGSGGALSSTVGAGRGGVSGVTATWAGGAAGSGSGAVNAGASGSAAIAAAGAGSGRFSRRGKSCSVGGRVATLGAGLDGAETSAGPAGAAPPARAGGGTDVGAFPPAALLAGPEPLPPPPLPPPPPLALPPLLPDAVSLFSVSGSGGGVSARRGASATISSGASLGSRRSPSSEPGLSSVALTCGGVSTVASHSAGATCRISSRPMSRAPCMIRLRPAARRSSRRCSCRCSGGVQVVTPRLLRPLRWRCPGPGALHRQP